MAVRRRIRIIAISLAAALVLAVCLYQSAALALFDKGKAVQVDPDAIENCTLIIGTHMIYLHSLNEEIYKIAVQSAADSGQYKRYYKSEIAGGLWMDITDASSINDISAGGTVADLEEIRNLYLTHHTKSDGITYNLQTKQHICIFDIVYVYDLENMPELEALKLQYDVMTDSNSKTGTDKRNIKLIKEFWTTQVHTQKTVQYDKQLRALQEYYIELSADDAGSKYLETALGVMEKVSNERKVEVYKIVEAALERLQDKVSDLSNAGSDVQMDDALMTAISNSQYALSESRSEAEAGMLSEGTTVVDAKEYELSTDMISNAKEVWQQSIIEEERGLSTEMTSDEEEARQKSTIDKEIELPADIKYAEGADYHACDGQNIQLQYLDNIKNSRIVDAAEELKLLEELTERADVAYGIALSTGKTPEYDILAAQNVSHAALENRMRADRMDADAACGELEFLIQGTVDRKNSRGNGNNGNKEAQDYILLKIQEAAKFKSVIKQDEYAATYQDSVASYIQWLNTLLDSIKQPADSGRADGEKTIYEQKAELQELKLKALDALDLDTAKKIDAKIADLDNKISAMEQAQSEKLKDIMERKTALEKRLQENPQDMGIQVEISRLEAELAAGTSGISDGSQAANIMESKNEILKLLANGDTGSAAMGQLQAHIDVLDAMLGEGSPLALAAMKEVYAKMLAKSELGGTGTDDGLQDETGTVDPDNIQVRNNAYDGLLSAIENAVSESAVSTGFTGELTQESAGDVIADALGIDSLMNPDGSISDAAAGASDEELAASLLALGDFGGEMGENSQITALAQGLASHLGQSTDMAVFLTKKDQDELYVPAETLAGYLGYRYVWNETKRTAVLSKGRSFYSFTAYDREVRTEKEGALQMERPAGFSGQLYIPDSFVQDQFGCYIRDISGTEYSVLVNDKVVERSQEILMELLGKGGY